MANKFCTNCGAEMEENARFCTSCGTQETENAPAPEEVAPAKKTAPMNTKRLISLGFAALAFVLSFVMVILAFCPILTSVLPDGTEAKLKISPLHNVAFMFDAMRSQDEEDLMDSKLYDRYEDTMEDFLDEISGNEDEYDDLSAKEKRLLNKACILEARLALRSESSALTPTMVISAVLTLVYLLAAIALLAVSAWYVLVLLLNTEGVEERMASLRNAFGKLTDVSAEKVREYLVTGICAFPMVMLSLYASMFMTFDGASIKTVIAGPGVCVIVFSAILFAGLIAEKVLAGEIKLDRALLTRGIAFVCALLLTVLAFAPVISTKIKAEFAGRSKEKTVRIGVSAGMFRNWYLTDESRDQLDESLEMLEDIYDDKDDARKALVTNACPSFGYYKYRDVEDGEYNTQILRFILLSNVAGGYMGMGWLFGFVTVLNLLVVIAGCALMWCNLNAIAGGKTVEVIGKYAKRVALIAAVAALLIAILFAIMTTSTIDKYMKNDYKISVGVGAGIIFMVIFAVVNFLLPTIMDKVSAYLPKKAEDAPTEESATVQQD